MVQRKQELNVSAPSWWSKPIAAYLRAEPALTGSFIKKGCFKPNFKREEPKK